MFKKGELALIDRFWCRNWGNHILIKEKRGVLFEKIISIIWTILTITCLTTPTKAHTDVSETVILSKNDVEVAPSKDVKDLANKMDMTVRLFRTESITPNSRNVDGKMEKSITINNYL